MIQSWQRRRYKMRAFDVRNPETAFADRKPPTQRREVDDLCGIHVLILSS